MKYQLDTQILLWAAAEPTRLSAAARKLLNHPRNELLFSAASLWEITIKNSLGREDFRVEPRLLRRGLLDNGYLEIPVTSQHAVSIEGLPPLHKDQFDRMLLAQGTGRTHHAAYRRRAAVRLCRPGAQGLTKGDAREHASRNQRGNEGSATQPEPFPPEGPEHDGGRLVVLARSVPEHQRVALAPTHCESAGVTRPLARPLKPQAPPGLPPRP